VSSTRITRALEREHVPGVKEVVDSTGLFPSELLDDMVAGYLAGSGSDRWWVVGKGVVSAVVYCAPERMTHNAWNMLLLAVRADRHGQGIGRAAVASVEAELARSGARLLLVETSGLPEFARTRNFYRSCGYEEEARIRDYYRAGEDKVVYRKVLAAGDDASG